MPRFGPPSERVGDLVWAAAVTWWVLVALVRVNAVLPGLHPYALLVAQVVPLGAATVVLLVGSPRAVAPERRGVLWASAALVALCGASAVWSSDLVRTAAQALVLAIAVAFLLTTLVVRWPARLAQDLTSLWAVGVAVSLAGVIARLAGVDLAVGIAGRSQGVVGNPNYFGMLLTTTIWAAAWLLVRGGASRWMRVLLPASVGLAIGALVTTGSRGSMLAVATGAVVLVVLARPRPRPGVRPVAGALVLATLVVGTWMIAPAPPEGVVAGEGGGDLGALVDRGALETDVTSGRLGLWQETAERTTDHPVLGHGYRSSEIVLDGLTTHDLPLTIALELGIVGLLLVGWLAWALAAAARAGGRADAVLVASAATLVVQELLESTLHAPSGPVALLQLVLLYALAAPSVAARSTAEDTVTPAVRD